jgi:hypothetical protein
MGPLESQYRAKTRVLVRHMKKGFAPDPSLCTFEIVEGNLLDAPQKFKALAGSTYPLRERGINEHAFEKLGYPFTETQILPGTVISTQSIADSTRFFYLVTKENTRDKFFHNPEKFISLVQSAVENLAKAVIAENVNELAIPFICCGRSQLHWLYVQDLLRHNLKDVDIKVTVYHLPRPNPPSPLRRGDQAAEPLISQSPSVRTLAAQFECGPLDEQNWPRPEDGPQGKRHEVPPHRNQQEMMTAGPAPPPAPTDPPTPSPPTATSPAQIHNMWQGQSPDAEISEQMNLYKKAPYNAISDDLIALDERNPF